MNLAVDQALAEVIRRIVPVRLKDEIKSLRDENAHLKKRLDNLDSLLRKSGTDPCGLCGEWILDEEYPCCIKCDEVYCNSCEYDAFPCWFNCNFCRKCESPFECISCKNLFCKVHLIKCDKCDQFICNKKDCNDHRYHP
jgi:hypothetical protein